MDGLHGAYRRCAVVAQLGQRGLRSALERGWLKTQWTGVVIEASRVLDVRTRAAAAMLTCGERAAITGLTAAHLHGCTAAQSWRTHVLLPYGHAPRSRSGLVVHHADRYRDDITDRDGLRILTLERVVCDLLCTARPRDALAVTDQALALVPERGREGFRRRVSQQLASRLDPRGTARGARLLSLATGRAESPPESWLMLAVVDLGYPRPMSNWWLVSPAGVRLYRLDLAWPELRVAVEYDGYAVHVGREAADAARVEDLRRRGWIVIRSTAADLQRPDRLDAELRTAFRVRGYLI